MLSKVRNVKGFTLIELMVVVAIIGIILAIAIPYYIAYKRAACDKAASGDLVQLAAALQRLETDREVVMNSDIGIPNADTTTISYLVGPYYGWGGGTRKCDVRIILPTAEEGQACAMNGSHPAGTTSRYLFRINLVGGADLPVTHIGGSSGGDCNAGAIIGGPTATCYTESMYEANGQSRTPLGVACSTITGGQ